ncbi:MAG TPA: Do family serine endopeptidase [Polyangiaceae bacterium]|jgi:serine protease Do|nr:Do family serine endopeptidase [Polyangiaceae bacterium]
MSLRKLIPLTALLLAAGVAGTGCQHSAAAAPPDSLASTPPPFATPPVLPGTPDIATLTAKVRPAVVNITTIHEIRQSRQEFNMPNFPGFGDLAPFFHQGPDGRLPNRGDDDGEGDAVMKQQALGSGFIIDRQGHVVTNAHVIDGADKVKVRLADDREYQAKVVGKDTRLDVAVLKLENPPADLPTTSLGVSEALRVGEYVVAIGNPFGLGNTVTMGIVSAKGRTIGAGPYDDFIQTDASINPGNSGGPLFNLRGQVVGINTAINPNGKGIGFAIPIDAVRDVIPQLLATGHVSRGKIGVVIQGMDEDLAKAVGLDHAHGALVEDVEPGGPGDRAGIKSGDVIVSVDGQDVPHSEDLPRLVARHAPGTAVDLAIYHEGKKHDVSVTLAALKDEGADRSDGAAQDSTDAPNDRSSALGIAVSEEGGRVVVARVQSDGPSDGKLRPGDVIEEVGGQKVASAADLTGKVHGAVQASPTQPILLRVKRGDQMQFVAISPRASAGAGAKN